MARIDRVDGAFRVVTIEDATGTMIFRHENGKLARGAPTFAASLQARGHGVTLSKLLT
ncbi:MAG: hypothetical protein JSS04_18475 [Proteobacteria bacterium]|nr:hypothetical protein [Pseudomonadota bacterium]